MVMKIGMSMMPMETVFTTRTVVALKGGGNMTQRVMKSTVRTVMVMNFGMNMTKMETVFTTRAIKVLKSGMSMMPMEG